MYTTVPSINSLFINTIYLSHSTELAKGPFSGNPWYDNNNKWYTKDSLYEIPCRQTIYNNTALKITTPTFNLYVRVYVLLQQ